MKTKPKIRYIDETGHRYGKLTVIEPVRKNNKGKIHWRCICDCGKEIICSGSDLRMGRRTSCGNRCNSIKDETGKTYGYLDVLYRDPTPARLFADGCIHWICKCQNCGGITSISGKSLRDGTTTSCGCIKSRGEVNITKALQNLGLSFKKEYTFDDLISPLSKLKLRFDFAIFDQNEKLIFLIEHQGNQHWKQISYFGNKLERIRICDEAKKKYCFDNDIPCLYILVTKRNKVSSVESMEEAIKDFLEDLSNEISN